MSFNYSAGDGLNAELPTYDKACDDEQYGVDDKHHNTDSDCAACSVIDEE